MSPCKMGSLRPAATAQGSPLDAARELERAYLSGQREPRKARCRFHGGLSTGPRTDQGRARIAEAQRRRWRAYRASQSPNQMATVGPGETASS